MRNLRWIWMLAVAQVAICLASVASARQSVLYGGGPLYTNAADHRERIRKSGFTTLVIWTLHVQADGDLVLNNQKIIDDGVYVGRANWPSEVAAFRSGPTSVSRIEFGLSGHESDTFLNIRDLTFSQGNGPDGALYRNFQALKNVLPMVDGINYDEESHMYDQNVLYTMKQFSLMLADLGFNIELDVFCCADFWRDVFNFVNGERPGTIDRIDLQCYAGGGGNDPSWWNGQFGGLRVTPGLWAYPASESGGYWARRPNQVLSQMGTWNSSNNIAGGFMWYLDDMLQALDQHSVADYGNAINQALGIDSSRGIAATVYEHTAYRGWGVELGTGPYGEVELGAAGGQITGISSIKVRPGWRVTLFSEANFWGDTLVLTANDNSLVDNGWNDRAKSILVTPVRQPEVRLYQHSDYWGWSAGFGLGSYTLAQITAAGGVNDDPTSLEVPPGFKVTLYEHDHFQGESLVLTADDPSLVDNGWNDRASSMIVSVDPERDQPVRIYQNAGYWGGWQAAFDPGTHNLAAIVAAGGRNDDITSLKVAPGYVVLLFEHDNFQGRETLFTGDDLCLFDDGWNDRASSLIVSTPDLLPYYRWVIGAGLAAGGNDGPDADADGDGRSNLVEFAENTDPLSGAGGGAVAAVREFGGSRHITLTLAVREGAVFVPAGSGGLQAEVDGVRYTIEGSLDLRTFDSPVQEVTPALADGLPALDQGWKYRSFRLAVPISTAPRGFILRKVGAAD
ncbi:MAG: hypothetical protein J0M04_17985 [Verrucomicrobia bacterium]|nr:hypothetical protein [Verrucomicrobiota bacterium]